MFATWMLGAVWVPTNFRLTPPEVAYLATSSGASVHIFDSAFPDHAAAAKRGKPGLPAGDFHRRQRRAGLGGAGRRSTPPVTRAADVDHDHPAWFFYTSGTTGRPKAGVLTHGQMEYVVCNHLCDLMPATTEHDVSLVRRAAVARRRRARPAAGGARRRHGAAVGRTAGLRGSLAPGRTASRHQHVHRADDPDHADPARCGGPLRPCSRCATSSMPARRCTAPTRCMRCANWARCWCSISAWAR